MLKKSLYLLLMLLIPMQIIASDKDILKGYIYDSNNEPIVGANIYWEQSKKGTTSNMEGYFEIESTNAHEHLMVTYTGYISQAIHIEESDKELTVVLEEDTQLLSELVISRRSPGTVNRRDALLQTQHVTRGEIHRAACCNLGESFETNPSVDVSYSDAAVGARQIKLLGLAGTYVQMLTETIPTSGASSSFAWITSRSMDGWNLYFQRCFICKKHEALTGQIMWNTKSRRQWTNFLSTSLPMMHFV